MSQQFPSIQLDTLHYWQDGAEHYIRVGTPPWYKWLQAATSFTFSSDAGTFTARKEAPKSKEEKRYWKAYRRREGSLHRIYLGKSDALTLECLQQAALILAGALISSKALNAMKQSISLSLQMKPLPVPLGQLFGREKDIEDLKSLLLQEDVRLLTVLGPVKLVWLCLLLG